MPTQNPQDPEYLPPSIQYVDIDSLELWEDNPRFNDDAVSEVAKSIREFGFLVPVVIDQFNKVFAGNTRLKAARGLGLRKIPVVRADHLSDKQLKAFAIADNKLHEISDWDYRKLLSLVSLEEIREIPGYDADDMDRLNAFLLKESRIDVPKEEPEKGTSKIQHTCPKCGHAWNT